MQARKVLRSAELLMRHCNETRCDDGDGICPLWDDALCQCSLMAVRSPGHFPMEEIRERVRRRETQAQARPDVVQVQALPRRSRRDMVAERFVLED